MSNISQFFGSGEEPIGSIKKLITSESLSTISDDTQWIKEGFVYQKTDYPLLYDKLKKQYWIKSQYAPLEDTLSTVSFDTNSQNFYDIEYANNLYVAVSNYNRIFSSTDGAIWIKRLESGLLSTSTLYKVSYGNSLWIANGNSKTYTSINGTSWTETTANYTGECFSLSFFSNVSLWVSSGNGGIKTSTDGITWTTRTSSIPYNIKFFENNFHGFDGSYHLTSTDGITWTKTTKSSEGIPTNMNDVFYDASNNYYVGFTDAKGVTVTSTNLLTWVTTTNYSKDEVNYGGINTTKIAQDENIFYFINNTNTYLKSKYYSCSNYSNILQHNVVKNLPINRIKKVNSKLFILNDDIQEATTSIKNSIPVLEEQETLTSISANSLIGIIYPYIIWKSTGVQYYYNIDTGATTTATITSSPFDKCFTFKRTTFGGNKIFRVTAGGYKTSATGTVYNSTEIINDFIGNGIKAVGACNNGTIISGTNFTSTYAKYIIAGSNNLKSIVCDKTNANYFVCGDGGSLYTSTNSTTWSQITTGETENISKLLYDENSTFIAIGENYVWKSVNGGTDWTKSLHNLSFLPTDGAYVNELFIVYDSSKYGYSSDGISWTERDLGEVQSLFPYMNGFIIKTSDGNVSFTRFGSRELPYASTNLNGAEKSVLFEKGCLHNDSFIRMAPKSFWISTDFINYRNKRFFDSTERILYDLVSLNKNLFYTEAVAGDFYNYRNLKLELNYGFNYAEIEVGNYTTVLDFYKLNNKNTSYISSLNNYVSLINRDGNKIQLFGFNSLFTESIFGANNYITISDIYQKDINGIGSIYFNNYLFCYANVNGKILILKNIDDVYMILTDYLKGTNGFDYKELNINGTSVAANSSIILMGSDSGLYFSTNGLDFEKTNELQNAKIKFIRWDSTANKFYLSANNFYATSSDGLTWTKYPFFINNVNDEFIEISNVFYFQDPVNQNKISKLVVDNSLVDYDTEFYIPPIESTEKIENDLLFIEHFVKAK